jgi:release factor glutamine methyltransferase
MTIQEALKQTTGRLTNIYTETEATVISEWTIEYLTGIGKRDRALQKEQALLPGQSERLEELLQRLLQHEPIQYVLNESWFCGYKFFVDQNVLIPRPETEELVEWIISNCKFPIDKLKIFDVGTGSGCIPISLKRKLRKAEVWSADISEGALQVARKNATDLGAEVNFLQLDFLNRKQWIQLPSFDIIVSNPPYVPTKDKEQMSANVLQYEPHNALFVPDNDPLIFYKNIVDFCSSHLNNEGSIFLEIHESLGKECKRLFEDAGYTTELKKDMQNKDRMVKCKRKV